jgi:hypothetical protein
MQNTDMARRSVRLYPGLDQQAYNFEHFRTTHLLDDMRATDATRGIQPGAMAPDFELTGVDGGRVRLSELRGKPTLLHFGSFT